MEFKTPTEIQGLSIPIVMEGRDLLATAQTGTGKTAAFGIPMITNLLTRPKQSIGLVLVPTRELAAQVTDVIRGLTFHLPQVRIVTLIGGVGMAPQIRALKVGFRIVVATPGRLIDHIERKTIDLSHVEILTLDEADRMLDMGFAPALKQIFKHIPAKRQTLLFSATMPAEIVQITKNLLHDPANIKVGAVSKPIDKITQTSRFVNGDEKSKALIEELEKRQGSIIIFVRTQKRADRLSFLLEGKKFYNSRIHGGRSQGQRTRALDDFKTGKTPILVATDIAARGIDVKHVAHVINYDLPQVAEDYVHRIGRTARNGRDGEALSIIAPDERAMWKDIERLLKKASGLPVETLTEVSNEKSTFVKNTAKPQKRDFGRSKFKPKTRALIKLN